MCVQKANGRLIRSWKSRKKLFAVVIIILVEVSYHIDGSIFLEAIILLYVDYVSIDPIINFPGELRAKVFGDHSEAARLGERV